MTQTLQDILKQKRLHPKLPDGVGKLRITQLGHMMDFSSISIKGKLNYVEVKEVLDFGKYVATYNSGTVFQGELPNLQVLAALEAIASIDAKKLKIPYKAEWKGQPTEGIPITDAMGKVLATVGYVQEPQRNSYSRSYWSKTLKK